MLQHRTHELRHSGGIGGLHAPPLRPYGMHDWYMSILQAVRLLPP